MCLRPSNISDKWFPLSATPFCPSVPVDNDLAVRHCRSWDSQELFDLPHCAIIHLIISPWWNLAGRGLGFFPKNKPGKSDPVSRGPTRKVFRLGTHTIVALLLDYRKEDKSLTYEAITGLRKWWSRQSSQYRLRWLSNPIASEGKTGVRFFPPQQLAILITWESERVPSTNHLTLWVLQ